MQQRCEVDLLLIVLSAIACPVLFTISDKYLILPAIVPYMRYADSCVRERGKDHERLCECSASRFRFLTLRHCTSRDWLSPSEPRLRWPSSHLIELGLP
jgi:hypothetical protein